MSCDKIRAQLTSYLDGELADERGSAVRGHLRGCDGCRQVAEDEAALRDGLRALPPCDPPASLWAGVQAQLAAAEVADAKKPGWRRALARLVPRMPSMPQLALGSAVVAAAVVLIVVRAKQSDDGQPEKVVSAPEYSNVIIEPSNRPPTPPAPPAPIEDDSRDVTDVLAAAPARVSEDHAAVVRELVPIAEEAKARWTDEQRREFDGQLVKLQHEVDGAKNERTRQRHYRTLIRYLQRAAIRDDVALADAGGAR